MRSAEREAVDAHGHAGDRQPRDLDERGGRSRADRPEMVDERVPEHGEDLKRMQKNKLLIDADAETKKQLLLQIFTTTLIGTLLLEIIQRI